MIGKFLVLDNKKSPVEADLARKNAEKLFDYHVCLTIIAFVMIANSTKKLRLPTEHNFFGYNSIAHQRFPRIVGALDVEPLNFFVLANALYDRLDLESLRLENFFMRILLVARHIV